MRAAVAFEQMLFVSVPVHPGQLPVHVGMDESVGFGALHVRPPSRFSSPEAVEVEWSVRVVGPSVARILTAVIVAVWLPWPSACQVAGLHDALLEGVAVQQLLQDLPARGRAGSSPSRRGSP